jgi:FkbM family methyltransferase
LLECESGIYGFDFKDKVVLDVGAYCGESAVFFSSHGAKKVILYEPFSGHQTCIKNNISLNHMNAELHNEGVGAKDEPLMINYDDADLGFGLKNEGKNQTLIKVRNISDVLNESGADIAKIDCEGAEISLNEVSKSVLRKISLYIIETHNSAIKKALTKKFEAAGFRHMHEPVHIAESIDILYLARVPN